MYLLPQLPHPLMDSSSPVVVCCFYQSIKLFGDKVQDFEDFRSFANGSRILPLKINNRPMNLRHSAGAASFVDLFHPSLCCKHISMYSISYFLLIGQNTIAGLLFDDFGGVFQIWFLNLTRKNKGGVEFTDEGRWRRRL